MPILEELIAASRGENAIQQIDHLINQHEAELFVLTERSFGVVLTERKGDYGHQKHRQKQRVEAKEPLKTFFLTMFKSAQLAVLEQLFSLNLVLWPEATNKQGFYPAEDSDLLQIACGLLNTDLIKLIRKIIEKYYPHAEILWPLNEPIKRGELPVLMAFAASFPEYYEKHRIAILHSALRHNQIAIASLCLSEKPDLLNSTSNGMCEPPLHTAAICARLEGVQWLLARGAKLNFTYRSLAGKRSTALEAACEQNHKHSHDLVIACLETLQGAFVHALAGEFSAVQELSISVPWFTCNARNEHGNTLLHLAAQQGLVEDFEYLLLKADSSLTNDEGETAMQMAACCGHLARIWPRYFSIKAGKLNRMDSVNQLEQRKLFSIELSALIELASRHRHYVSLAASSSSSSTSSLEVKNHNQLYAQALAKIPQADPLFHQASWEICELILSGHISAEKTLEGRLEFFAPGQSLEDLSWKARIEQYNHALYFAFQAGAEMPRLFARIRALILNQSQDLEVTATSRIATLEGLASSVTGDLTLLYLYKRQITTLGTANLEAQPAPVLLSQPRRRSSH